MNILKKCGKLMEEMAQLEEERAQLEEHLAHIQVKLTFSMAKEDAPEKELEQSPAESKKCKSHLHIC
jgi:hypothetical protein